MKKTILTLCITLVSLLLPVIVSHVSAQSSPALMADIPFSFTVCREQLPAGKYIIQHPSGSTHVLVIRGEDKRSIDIACVSEIQSREAIKEARLNFNRYGDQYFLAEAWWPGDTMGHELVKTDQEKSLIKEWGGADAKRAKKPEKVIIKMTKPGKSN